MRGGDDFEIGSAGLNTSAVAGTANDPRQPAQLGRAPAPNPGRGPLSSIQFGAELRRLRLRAGWSQDRIAEELGGLRNQWSDYERGLRRPNRGRVRAADKALGADGALLAAYGDPAVWRLERRVAELERELSEARRTIAELANA